MAIIKYIGDSHIREVSAEDFASIGAEGQGGISLDTRLGERARYVEVTDEAADRLLERDNAWERADAIPEPEEDQVLDQDGQGPEDEEQTEDENSESSEDSNDEDDE